MTDRRLSPFELEEAKRRFDFLGRVRVDVPDLKRISGGRWRGRCPFHGGVSFDVVPDRQFAHCFGCEWSGDPIKYIRDVTGATFVQALEEITGGAVLAMSPEIREARENEERARAADIARKRRENINAAHRIWSESEPIDGSPAARYLEGRGLVGPFPETLRYHPRLACRFEDTETGKERRLLRKALVAQVMAPAGDLVTLHRIYLDELEDGAVVKARGIPADDVKKLHGSPQDGAIRLARRAPSLVLVEGIETGLAVLQSLRPVRPATVWAAISAGQLLRVAFPPDWRPAEVVIFADHDRPKWNERLGRWIEPAGQSKAEAAARRFSDMGVPARVAIPKEPGDWLDVLTRQEG